MTVNINPHCKICCADEMIVGRWYKLVCYPTNKGAILDYTVNFSTTNTDIVTLLHDTIYIKKTGTFTISCVDMYGFTDSKTITAIAEPTISRTTINDYEPNDWEDFRSYVETISTPTCLVFKKGNYNFDITDTNIDLPYGCVIDFNGSVINISSSYKTYKGLRILKDYCCIENAKIIGVDMGPDNTVEYSEGCAFITIYSGKYPKIQNIVFKDVAGFNLLLGTWNRVYQAKPSWKNGQWYEANNYNGYIGDDGELVSLSTAWTMTEMQPIINTSDNSYGVGYGDMWIPTTVRLYDIAFYDSNKNLIEVKRDQQFFRLYYYPTNAAYVRFGIWQDNEPKNDTITDPCSIMYMMMGNNTTPEYPTVKEAYLDNIVHLNTMSGIFSGVGICEDVHINRFLTNGQGWKNAWSFDIEDSWNSACGYVISHSFLSSGNSYTHGAQGVTYISSIIGSAKMMNNVHFPTIINCDTFSIANSSTRGNLTICNSYHGTVTDGDGASYSFGDRATSERYRITNRLSRKTYI